MQLRSVAAALISFVLPLFASAKESPQKTLSLAQSRLDALLASAPAKGSAASRARRAKLEAEAKELLDFEELSRRALGKHWESGTPDQKSEFVSLFSILVQDTYLDQLEGQSAKGLSLAWGNEEIQGSLAKVEAVVSGTRSTGKPVEIQVVYKLILHPSGWMLYDLVTDGSSLASSYKSTFTQMFKKEGDFEGVLGKLRAKLGKKAPSKIEEKAAGKRVEEPAFAAAPKPPKSPEPKKPAPVVKSPKSTPPALSRWEVFCSSVASTLRSVFFERISFVFGYLLSSLGEPVRVSS